MKLDRIKEGILPPWVSFLFSKKFSWEERADRQAKLMGFLLTKDGTAFAEFVEEELVERGVKDSSKCAYTGEKLERLPGISFGGRQLKFELQPGHFAQFPPEDALNFYVERESLSRLDAATPGVWTAVMLRELKKGDAIKNPAWLLEGRGGGRGFESEMEKLKSYIAGRTEAKSAKALDRQTRRVLRTLTGEKSIRGQESLFSACAISAAWWVGAITEDVSRVLEESGSPLPRQRIAAALMEQWMELGDTISRKLTAMSDREILAGYVLAFNRKRKNKPDWKMKNEQIKKIAYTFGCNTAVRFFDAESASDLVTQVFSAPPATKNKKEE